MNKNTTTLLLRFSKPRTSLVTNTFFTAAKIEIGEVDRQMQQVIHSRDESSVDNLFHSECGKAGEQAEIRADSYRERHQGLTITPAAPAIEYEASVTPAKVGSEQILTGLFTSVAGLAVTLVDVCKVEDESPAGFTILSVYLLVY